MSQTTAPKKIALVYDAIYPYIKGGAEKRFYELGKALSAQGHEVHLYGMQFWDGPRIIRREGMYLHGLCKARPLYTSSGKRSMLPPIIFGFSCLRLLRERFDVIDCCGFPYFSLFSCKLVSLMKRKPLHATWHEVWGRTGWRTYLGRLGSIGFAVEWLGTKLPTAFFAVSEHTATALREQFHPKQPIHIMPNGIHLDEFKAVKPSRAKYNVLYAGRLIEHKHIDVLLRAMAQVHVSFPKASCLIVGDGPQRQQLQTLCTELQLDGQVQFRDFVTQHRELIALMKAARVFVLPSTREGFGLVALEANAAGIPVITTDHPDNAARSLVHGENGEAVALEPYAFADQIERALQGEFDPEACKQAARSHDWNTIAEQMEALI